MNFEEWLQTQPQLASNAAEIRAAAAGWNAAIAEARRIATSSAQAESTVRNMVVLQDTELEFLMTKEGY